MNHSSDSSFDREGGSTAYSEAVIFKFLDMRDMNDLEIASIPQLREIE